MKLKLTTVTLALAAGLALGLALGLFGHVSAQTAGCGPLSKWTGAVCIGPKGKAYCPQGMTMQGQTCVTNARPNVSDAVLPAAALPQTAGCGPLSKWTGAVCVGPKGKAYCPLGMTIQGQTCVATTAPLPEITKLPGSTNSSAAVRPAQMLHEQRPPLLQQSNSRVAQPVKLMDGSRAMTWNDALYIRGANGQWQRAGAGAHLARGRFTITTQPGGHVLHALLRNKPPVNVAAQQTIIHVQPGAISVPGKVRLSTLKLRPLFPTFAPVLQQNTGLKVSTINGPPVTHGEFQRGKWDLSTTLGCAYSVCQASFQWTTDPSVVKRVIWQLSTIAFPPGPVTNTNWDSPFKGYKGSVEQPGPVAPTNQFSVDLGKYAAFDNDQQHPKNWVARVVPLDQDGNLAGLPSNPVYLITPVVAPMGPLGPSEPVTPPKHYPDVAMDSWRPAQQVAASDAYDHPPAMPSSIITTVDVGTDKVVSSFPPYVQEKLDDGTVIHSSGGGFIPANTTIYLDWSPPDEGTDGFNAFFDFVTQLGDYIESAVNWVSSTFNTIKNAAVSAVADVMTTVGVPAGIANAVADAVVNAVMVEAGIPPSLPDMDELEDKGIGFVVDTAADQIGADPQIVQAAQSQVVSNDQIRQGVQSAVSHVKAAQPDSNNWFVLDPTILYHPPVLFLRASFNPSAPSSGARSDALTETIEIRSKLGTDSWQLDEQNGACENMLLWTGSVRIPPLAPGESILVPVVLDFSFNGPEQDEVASCNATPVKDAWMATYDLSNSGHFPFEPEIEPLTQPWQR